MEITDQETGTTLYVKKLDGVDLMNVTDLKTQKQNMLDMLVPF